VAEAQETAESASEDVETPEPIASQGAAETTATGETEMADQLLSEPPEEISKAPNDPLVAAKATFEVAEFKAETEMEPIAAYSGEDTELPSYAYEPPTPEGKASIEVKEEECADEPKRSLSGACQHQEESPATVAETKERALSEATQPDQKSDTPKTSPGGHADKKPFPPHPGQLGYRGGGAQKRREADDLASNSSPKPQPGKQAATGKEGAQEAATQSDSPETPKQQKEAVAEVELHGDSVIEELADSQRRVPPVGEADEGERNKKNSGEDPRGKELRQHDPSASAELEASVEGTGPGPQPGARGGAVKGAVPLAKSTKKGAGAAAHAPRPAAGAKKASRAASARAGELRDEPVANAASPTLPAAEARPDAGATQPAPGPAPGEAGSASTKKGPPAKDKPKRGDKKAAQAASAAPETRTSAKTEEEAAQLVAKVSEQANKAKPKPAKAGEVAALSRPEPAEQGPPANKKGKKTSKPTNRDAVLSAVATQPLLPNHMGSLTAPVTMPGSEGDSQRKEKAPARTGYLQKKNLDAQAESGSAPAPAQLSQNSKKQARKQVQLSHDAHSEASVAKRTNKLITLQEESLQPTTSGRSQNAPRGGPVNAYGVRLPTFADESDFGSLQVNSVVCTTSFTVGRIVQDDSTSGRGGERRPPRDASRDAHSESGSLQGSVKGKAKGNRAGAHRGSQSNFNGSDRQFGSVSIWE